MNNSEEIVNRVAKSSLININLEDFFPAKEQLASFDLKTVLHKDSVLIEKEFRKFVKKNNWKIYKNKYVNVSCSNDAIIPLWSKLLICGEINKHANLVVLGSKKDLLVEHYKELINSKIKEDDYKNKKLIIKGCSEKAIPQESFAFLYNKLCSFAESIMYGEACSSVPLFKKK